MAVVLALCSALAYGLSDFVGGLVSRRTTAAWPVAVVGQISSVACVSLVACFVAGSPTAYDFGWAVLGGAASGVGTGFLYRGLSSGRMGVVAPVSAVGAALVPVLVGVLAGERLPWPVWLGIAAAFPAVWLVSSSGDHSPATPTSATGGLVDASLAGLGFGVLFAALGQVPAESGLWPLATAQATSVPAVVVLALCLRAPWLPRGRAVWWGLVAGPLGASAVTAFLLASQAGVLSIAGVLSSLYPAVTVLLAALVLHERIHRVQGMGLALCAVAVALVARG
jgi:uncharacterized membrane protein